MVRALSSCREMGMKEREGSGQGRQATKKASPPPQPAFRKQTQCRIPPSPRGCKGRSPLHKIILISPFPPGRGLGGWGQERKLKAGQAGDKEGKPPLGTCKAESAGGKECKPPATTRFPQATPVPHPSQPRGCKGRSPLHEITLVSPFPGGEERSASAGRGDILPLRGRGAAK